MNYKIKLLVSYDGSEYSGWQKQPGGRATVQETLQTGIERIFNQEISLVGASRTDAGVHALGQVAHFSVDKLLNKRDLSHAINAVTPPTLIVKDAWIAPDEFHANLSPVQKTYVYRVLNRDRPSPFRYKYTTHIPWALDLAYLNTCSKYLVGKQDFKSFQNTGTEVKTSVREIFSASWKKSASEDSTLEFWITGDGFLKQMIRNIVGTLFDMQKEGALPEKMGEVITQCDRTAAGTTAAPQGLYLYRVEYPEELDNKCRKL